MLSGIGILICKGKCFLGIVSGYQTNIMIKCISGLEENSLVSSDLYLIGKLIGQVWLLFSLSFKGWILGNSCNPSCAWFSASADDLSSGNASVCSSAIKFFDFFPVLVITY